MNEPTEPQEVAAQPNETSSVVEAPTAESAFAWMRTRLAADSMLMGWMGLATTLIGFGFTIVQFFDRLEEMSSAKPALAPRASHLLGLALILLGVFGLGVAIGKYVAFVRRLHSEPFSSLATMGKLPMNKPAVAIAAALLAIGATAFLTITFRLS
jgi:putative membrane protein